MYFQSFSDDSDAELGLRMYLEVNKMASLHSSLQSGWGDISVVITSVVRVVLEVTYKMLGTTEEPNLPGWLERSSEGVMFLLDGV